MNDKDKTKEQLIKESLELRQKVAEFDKTRAESINTDNKVQTMLDNIVIGVAMINPKMEIVWLNKTFKRWFPDIDIGKKPLCYQSFYAPPKDKTCDYCPTVISFKTGGIHSSETGVCADGRIYNVIAVPVKDESGKIKYVVETVEDITERKKIEEVLRQSEEKFRLSFENAKDAIFWGDTETGLIIKCNEAAEALIEKKREEIIGYPQTMLHPPQKSKYYSEMFKEHIAHKGAIDVEAEVITKSGKIKPVHITAALTLIGGRQIIQGVFRDITDRKQAEKVLKESEQRQRMQAHELSESNTALKVLLKQRENDRKEFEENILSNIKHLILPYIGKLKKNRETAQGLSYLNILESNLNEIISPFSAKLSARYLGFTPKEIQIANLIKDGKQDKDIMEILNISKDTAKTHRQNIRKKLGIYGKRTNLRTHLMAAIK